MSLTGDPDGPGYRAGASLFDIVTGLHCAIGILAALHQRQTTGQGQHVETNLLSSALSALANQASAFVAGNVIPQRLGNAHPSLFPYEPFPTADGDLIVVAANDGQFRKLCEALGLPRAGGRPRVCQSMRSGTATGHGCAQYLSIGSPLGRERTGWISSQKPVFPAGL